MEEPSAAAGASSPMLQPFIRGSPRLPRHPAALSKQGRRASFVEPATRRSGRKLGIPLAALAIFGISCDALLIKLAGDAGASAAVVVIVKYGAITFFMALILAAMRVIDVVRPPASGPLLQRPTPRGAWYMCYASVLCTLESLSYTLGFAYTTSANVLAFAALAPMWSALFTWFYLSIIVPARTRVAVSVGLLGSGIVAYGVRDEFGAGATFAATFGIVCAIGAGVVAAANFTVHQAASITAPTAPMMICKLIGGFLSFACGWLLLLSPSLHPPGAPLMPAEPIALLYLVLSGTSAFLDALIVIACLLVSATEIALIMQIEAFISPMLTFLVLAEVPSLFTLAGGLLIISVVAVNEVAAVAYPDERVAERMQTLSMVGLREFLDPSIELEPLSSMGSLPKLPHVSLSMRSLPALPHVRGRSSRVSDLSSVGEAEQQPALAGDRNLPAALGAGSTRTTAVYVPGMSPERIQVKAAAERGAGREGAQPASAPSAAPDAADRAAAAGPSEAELARVARRDDDSGGSRQRLPSDLAA